MKYLDRAYGWHLHWRKLINQPALGILELQPELLEIRKLTESRPLPDYWDIHSIKSKIREECKIATRCKAKISFVRPKAAQAIFDCKDPWSLVKDLH